MNDEANVSHNYYAPVLFSNNQEDVPTGKNGNQKNADFSHRNDILVLLLKKSKSLE